MSSSGNLLKLRLRPSAPSAHTFAWASQIIALGGSVSAAQFGRVNSLFRALDAAGISSKADDVWIRAMESKIQSNVSLYGLRQATEHNSPAWIPYRGKAYDGIASFDDTGFIPSSHAVQATPTSQEIASLEATNGNVNGSAAMGSQQDATRAHILYPHMTTINGNVIKAYLSSNIIPPASTTNTISQDARHLISAQLSDGVYLFRENGADLSPLPTAPLVPVNAMSNHSLYFGANNGISATDSYRQMIHVAAYFGAPLTLTEEAAFIAAIDGYLAAILPLVNSNVYVATTGSDANPGTQALPLATMSVGLFFVPPNGTLNFEDGAYVASADPQLGESGTIAAVNSRGATLSGYLAAVSNGNVFSVTASGGSVALNKLILDASLNSAGQGRSCIALRSTDEAYTLALSDCELTGYGSQGHAIWEAGDTATRVNLSLTDVDIASTDTRGGIQINSLVEGSVEITRGSITLTDTNGNAGSAATVRALASGCTAEATNLDVSVDVPVTFVGTVATGLVFYNMPALISGGTYTITSDNVGSSPTGYPVAISQGRITDDVALSIDGSIMDNVTSSNGAFGGALFRMGDDNADKSLGQDCVMSNLTGTGSTNFAADGGHCVFAVNLIRPYVHDCNVSTGGIGMVDKGNWDARIEDLVIADMNSSYYLNKASLRSVVRRLTCTSSAGYAGAFILFSVGNDNNDGIYGSADIRDSTFTNNGAVSQLAINHDDSRFGLAITGCTWELVSGSMDAKPFIINGVALTSAEFLAAYPGNTVVGF